MPSKRAQVQTVALVIACFLLVSCTASSCNLRSAPKVAKVAALPVPSPLPSPPALRLRDLLFPPRSCEVVLGREGAAVMRLTYDVEANGPQERIVLNAEQGGNIGSQTFFSDETQLSSKPWVGKTLMTPPWFGPPEVQVLGAKVQRYDLLAPAERVMATTETYPSAQGTLSPCMTSLWRHDVDRITRTYRTWCRGLGLVREDKTVGKTRLIAELQSTTCKPN